MTYLKRMYAVFIFIFLYSPIAVLIAYSFNKSRLRGHWGGFTFSWYLKLFHDRQIMQALNYTIAIALLSSVIATIMGTFAAIGIFNMGKLKKQIMMNITYIPVLSPEIVTGISLMILFIFLKMERGFMTLLIAHITFNTPYIILSVMPKLKQLNKHLYEAALDLGATPAYAFRKVILPEIMPGVLTGFLLAFTLSLDDFVISFFTTGSGVANLSIVVYSMARVGVNPKLNALSALMFICVLILLVIVNLRISKDTLRKENGHEKRY